MSASAIERLKNSSTATVCGILFKRGFSTLFMDGPKALSDCAVPMVGPAYTLRFLPAREDICSTGASSGPVHREAFEQTPPGHILVMECRGDTRAACCGDILVARLMVRGGGGLVTDGGVRDSAELAAMDMPIFAKGAAPPVSRVAHHPVEHGEPVSCGGVTVFPGDMIMGDADGVIVIPAAVVSEVAEAAIEKDLQDSFTARRILDGHPLQGNFPPDAATLKEYEAWRRDRSE